MPTIQLVKVANLLSLPSAKIVAYLASQGHEVQESPTAKITEEQYALLKIGFPEEFSRARGTITGRTNNPAPPPPISPIGPVKVFENIKIIRPGSRKKIRLKKPVKFASETPASDLFKSDNQTVHLGFTHTEVYNKGFGFLRQVGGKTDVWFHLSRVIGNAFDLNDLVVFTVTQSNKHPEKLEALWVQDFSTYIPEPIVLQTWYHSYRSNKLRQVLLLKMDIESKAIVLRKEIDLLKNEVPELIKSSLKQLIKNFFPPNNTDETREQLISIADAHISQSAAPGLQVYWWLTGLSFVNHPWELVTSFLTTCEPTLQLQVLLRSPTEVHYSLIESIFSVTGAEGLISLKQRGVPPTLKDKIDLFIKVNLSLEEEAKLFFAGKWDQVDLNYLLTNYHQLNAIRLFCVACCANIAPQDLRTFFANLIKIHLKHQPEHSQDIIHQLSIIDATAKASNKDLSDLVRTTIANEAPEYLRCHLWETELIDTVTNTEKEKWLTEKNFSLATLDTWRNATLIDHQEFQDLIQFALKAYPIIDSRPRFYGFHELLTKVKHQPLSFQPENQVFFGLSSWLTDPDTYLLKEELNQKLVFLKPEHQILMLKKRFHLHETGVTNLSIEDLQRLRHIDLSLYQTAAEVAPELNLDLSVATVIHTIHSLAKDARLLVAGDLIGIMLENITSNRTQKFKITELFESCAGRMEMDFNWKITNNRKLFKVPFNNSYYWALQVNFGDAVIDDIKNLPGRKWNPEKQHWGVLRRYETEVLALARANNFFIDIEGSNYTNNTHLASAKRTKQPRGITYCEGRKANIPDRTHQKEFWWCANSPCFQNCETAHPPEDWRKYTLLDFCRILNLKIDDQDVAGQVVSKSQYYKFVATINRFNRLIEHLYCRECDEILSPTTETHFGARRISRFQCTKQSCSSHHKEVYLHHCLNGKCNSIIDSRDSKACPHGLYICANPNCGTCCSHKMFSDRLSNLQSTGGHISPSLILNVKNKEGHQERAEHFCYSCGTMMDKYPSDKYHCLPCNITYDLAGNQFQRSNSHLSSQTEKPGSPP